MTKARQTAKPIHVCIFADERVIHTRRWVTGLRDSGIRVNLVTLVEDSDFDVGGMALHGEGGYRLLTQDWSEYDKYGGKALEINGLPWEELAKWQRRAVVNFYLKNFRLIDFVRYFWQKRRALYFLIKKKITRIKRTKKRNN